MTTTDTFCCQHATELERAEWLLRLLACEYKSGIASTDVGLNCVYCDWADEDFDAEPEHEEGCPIRRVREHLWGKDAPYPWEGRSD